MSGKVIIISVWWYQGDVIEMTKQKTEIQLIAIKCIERWGDDSKTANFSNKLGKFLSQLGENREVGQILLELVKHYNYYSRAKVNEIFEEFHDIISNKECFNPNGTVYSVIEDDKKMNSSNTLFEEFRLHFDIPSEFGHRIDNLNIEDMDYIDNLIFFDDIIGTGKTVKDFFEKNREKLSKVNNYIFCIEVMNEALSMLNEFFKNENINCKIIYYKVSMKAFDEGIIFSSNTKQKELALRTFEESLWNHGNENIMGYNNSQAIISFFRNTPNNTISSFWCNRKQWNGLFPRNNERPQFMIKKTKNIRMNLKKAGLEKND